MEIVYFILKTNRLQIQSRRWVLQFENLQIELVGSIGFIAEAVLGGNGEKRPLRAYPHRKMSSFVNPKVVQWSKRQPGPKIDV